MLTARRQTKSNKGKNALTINEGIMAARPERVAISPLGVTCKGGLGKNSKIHATEMIQNPEFRIGHFGEMPGGLARAGHVRFLLSGCSLTVLSSKRPDGLYHDVHAFG